MDDRIMNATIKLVALNNIGTYLVENKDINPILILVFSKFYDKPDCKVFIQSFHGLSKDSIIVLLQDYIDNLKKEG